MGTTDIPSEHVEQVTFVREFEKQWPDVLIFAIPNGGFRHRATAEKLKLEGVKKGIPDLFIPSWRCFVEMKRQKGGRLSDDQKAIIFHLETVGYTCIVANGWEDGMGQLKQLMENTQ